MLLNSNRFSFAVGRLLLSPSRRCSDTYAHGAAAASAAGTRGEGARGGGFTSLKNTIAHTTVSAATRPSVRRSGPLLPCTM